MAQYTSNNFCHRSMSLYHIIKDHPSSSHMYTGMHLICALQMDPVPAHHQQWQPLTTRQCSIYLFIDHKRVSSTALSSNHNTDTAANTKLGTHTHVLRWRLLPQCCHEKSEACTVMYSCIFGTVPTELGVKIRCHNGQGLIQLLLTVLK